MAHPGITMAYDVGGKNSYFVPWSKNGEPRRSTESEGAEGMCGGIWGGSEERVKKTK